MCVLCGGVDHKTMSKWVKKFIIALQDLELEVVSSGAIVLLSF
jgi:hypothetical protein